MKKNKFRIKAEIKKENYLTICSVSCVLFRLAPYSRRSRGKRISLPTMRVSEEQHDFRKRMELQGEIDLLQFLIRDL